MRCDEKPLLSMIAALDEQGVIGYEGGIPWRLPDDMRWFRERTMGKPVIMGRKTHQSIGSALLGRHNIVVTRQNGYEAAGCEVVHSPAEALAAARLRETGEIVVIGGSSLYEIFLPYAGRLYLTYVQGAFAGDTYFPAFAEEEWQLTWQKEHAADERHEAPFRMVILDRKTEPAPWPDTTEEATSP